MPCYIMMYFVPFILLSELRLVLLLMEYTLYEFSLTISLPFSMLKVAL